jgi:hypothetical protein
VLFPEIDGVDPSASSGELRVPGVEDDGHRMLRAEAPTALNAIAAILLPLRDATGVRPQAHLESSDGDPLEAPVPVPLHPAPGRTVVAPPDREAR